MLTVALLVVGERGAMAQRQQVGACCARNPGGQLICVEIERSLCLALGGTFNGDRTSCSASNPCPSALTGACCISNSGGGGLSSPCRVLNEIQCRLQGGVYHGDGTACSALACPPPMGACCFGGGACVDSTTVQCRQQGGFYRGDHTVCATTSCSGAPTGACCIQNAQAGQSGTSVGVMCRVETRAQCNVLGGTYAGDGVTCAIANCQPPPPPVMTCCFANGACVMLTQQACFQMSGRGGRLGSACAMTSCPGAPTGACCLPAVQGALANNCRLLSRVNCTLANGVYQGDGTACQMGGCPPAAFVGACCALDPAGVHVCVDTSPSVCGVLGGVYSGMGTACATVNCPSCPCDLNGDGVVDLADEAIALANHAALNFDFDHDGDTDQDDLTAYYACVAAGC